MELFFRITLVFLLLVHVFHPGRPQETASDTPEPRPKATIPPAWLRELVPLHKVEVQPNGSSWPTTIEESLDDGTVESGNDYSSGGIPSGSMTFTEEDQVNETTDYPTQTPTFLNETTMQPDGNLTTTQSPKSDINMTNADTENSISTNETFTSSPTPQYNSSDDYRTDIQTSTTAPETNGSTTLDSGSGTNGSTTLDSGSGASHETENNETSTTVAPIPEVPEEETRFTDKPSTSARTTTTTGRTSTLPETTALAPTSPDRANLSDKGAGSGGTPERGFASDSQRRKSAWGAVLGTFVAVAFVGLVAYVILKKKHQKAFSHRKLVEEFPSDPVLRLDNNEPLDLNFGRAAYYNPALQGDHIQMNNFNKN